MSIPFISDTHLYDSSKKTPHACSVCGKVAGVDILVLRTCAGCRLIKYCSRQCQETNWCDHKYLCRQNIGKGIEKVARKLTANPVLRAHLQVCLALEFGMDKMSEGELRQLVRTPLFARLEVGIEPTSLRAMQRISAYRGPEWAQMDRAATAAYVGTRGMLQLHFLQRTDAEAEGLSVAQAQMEMWKKGRGAADRANEWHAPVVVVTCVDSVREAIGLVFVVMPDAIETARKRAPFRTYDPVDGEMYEEEMGVPAYFSHLNLHIRADTKNTLKLRMSVRACDVDLIRRARAPHPDDEADDSTVVAMRLKLRRELIYEVQDHAYVSGSESSTDGPRRRKKRLPFPLARATVLSRESSDEDSESDKSDEVSESSESESD